MRRPLPPTGAMPPEGLAAPAAPMLQLTLYTVGSVSFGVQLGGQEPAVVTLINGHKPVDGLMANAVKLGGDVSAAAGPVGVGQAANVTADFVSYAKAKGAFMGMSVEGSVLDVRAMLNQAYYGKEVTSIDIVSKRTVSNAHAAGLRKAIEWPTPRGPMHACQPLRMLSSALAACASGRN
jgi:lipid-binding SYLF domain-containing protein